MSEAAAQFALEAHNLGRSFAHQPVLEGIDLRVQQGEIFGILGPDGAGKTTLMQILAGILDPSTGACHTLGFDTRTQSAAVTSRIGYMAQGFTLYSLLSVEENLRFAAKIRGVGPQELIKRRQRLLAMAGLEQFRQRRADRLSGGMQKKLALCTNLIHEPPLLLLDEMSLGVDPLARRELWQMLLRLLRSEGKTIVLTTPYMDEADQCDRLALLHQGRLLASGSPAMLRATVQGPIYELISLQRDEAHRHVSQLPGLHRAQTLADRIRFGLAPDQRLQDADARALGEIGELRPAHASLEDVFIERTGGADGAVVVSPAPQRAGAAAAEESSPRVQVEDLTCRFGHFVAVDRVSFQIAPGQIFGFLGPNGAGKTTVIRALCGLLRPWGGRIEVAGVDVVRRPLQLRPRIGYMSQRFSLYPDLSVAENLAFFAGVYGLRRATRGRATADVIELVGLGDWQDHEAGQLSGAMRQRLALACSVVHQPAVLFLDEPTAGVDPLARQRFWQLIQRLAGQGMAVLVSTHYLEEATYCDRLGLMDRGRLIAAGSYSELRQGLEPRPSTVEELFIGYIQRARRPEVQEAAL